MKNYAKPSTFYLRIIHKLSYTHTHSILIYFQQTRAWQFTINIFIRQSFVPATCGKGAGTPPRGGHTHPSLGHTHLSCSSQNRDYSNWTFIPFLLPHPCPSYTHTHRDTQHAHFTEKLEIQPKCSFKSKDQNSLSLDFLLIALSLIALTFVSHLNDLFWAKTTILVLL